MEKYVETLASNRWNRKAQGSVFIGFPQEDSILNHVQGVAQEYRKTSTKNHSRILDDAMKII